MAFPGMVPDAAGFSASATVTVFFLVLRCVICCVTVCLHVCVCVGVSGCCACQFERPLPNWSKVSLLWRGAPEADLIAS